MRYWAIVFMLTGYLPGFGGEIVFKNNQKIKSLGGYEIKDNKIYFKNMKGDLMMIPVKMVDLDRCKQEDAPPPKPKSKNNKKRDFQLYEMVEDPGRARGGGPTKLTTDDIKRTRRKAASTYKPGPTDDYRTERIMFTVERNKLTWLKLLLKDGFPLQGELYDGFDILPLHLAVIKGSVPMVEVMLLHNADPDVQLRNGECALSVAIKKATRPHDEIFLLLLKKVLNISQRDPMGFTPLHLAVARKKLTLVKALLDQKASTELLDMKGNSALQMAMARADFEIVKALVEAGADVQNGGSMGPKPIHISAGHRDNTLMKYLLENGARADEPDSEGNTLLIHAVLARNKETARLLLDHGANPSQHSANGSILEIAIGTGNTPMVDMILAEIKNLPDRDNLLVKAVQAGSTHLAQAFVNKGASVNAYSEKGDPMLNIAARNGDLEMVRLLLVNGADVYLKGAEGFSAYLEADGSRKKEIKLAIKAYLKR